MKKVVVVEDDREVRLLVKECLESSGFSVDVFADGSSFTSYFQVSDAPDCVIIDLILPGIGGVDLLSGIKKKWSNAKIFVFLAIGIMSQCLKNTLMVLLVKQMVSINW